MQDNIRAIRFIEGTKVSHDYDDNEVKTFNYRKLIEDKNPCIGIPCKQNGIFVVDVDVEGPTHKKDGREWWSNFIRETGVDASYIVVSPSGGFHFYFKLPLSVNPETFSPPNELAPGVDIKYRGWVGSPPTAGYAVVKGDIGHIEDAPPALMLEIQRHISTNQRREFDVSDSALTVELHRPFTEAQIAELRGKIEWMQSNATLSRSEWRDGIFALKAGIEDPVLLDELLVKWSQNNSYSPGDEDVARDMAAKASRHGGVGPGTILSIIRNVQVREGTPTIDSPFTVQEILDRSRVQYTRDSVGRIKSESSESNAAALIGAIYTDDILYHDTRTDLYIFKGRSASDQEIINHLLPVLQSPVSGFGFDKFRKSTVAGGLDIVMAARGKDPHQEYLKKCKWDGIPRIERFFIDYVGTEDSEYLRLVGTNFWTSLAARGLRPGCKFDSMVVLEGHEGIAKSSLVEAIGGEYTFAPARKDSFENLDELRKMHQAVIVELPELLGLVGESAEKVKGFLAKPFDHIRALFAKKAMKHNRGFVFVGTTNSDKYLAATMGVRRFWPVKIPKGRIINLARVKADRDQLFAEGIVKMNEGHPFWHMPSELLDTVVATRVLEEPLMDPINKVVTSYTHCWSSTDVYKALEGAGFITKGLTTQVLTRIDSSLHRLGYRQEFCADSKALMWKPKLELKLGLENLI